ncbi:glutamate--cysteine ligase [Galbitalea sp. SE-J8]|uniref:carboxylate-amine ligase n=1 Tax=Galbitalea sp. SE-J8 TaxID=3054952 RepID=UPI00259C75EB|nr:glutamate--cysteine ligase [Galbitalea sp. SE-J8]MDM4761396.1 glutamate--cysteine ligase [Galbitalea sp. SE-J8]
MRTVGVEEEFLLLDPSSGQPVAASLRVRSADADGDPGDDEALQFELQQEMIEAATSPCTTLDEVRAHVGDGRRRADAAARSAGARAAALAMSPLPVQPHLTPTSRYGEMMRRYGRIAARSLSCGMHVHVRIESREEGVAIMDRIRVWLPVLLALSANSPFEGGADTGIASYRRVAWTMWPSSGPLEVLGSVDALDRLERELLATGTLLDAGMLYFDARLSRAHPTIEVRIADVCLDADDAVTIAGLVRGLVEHAVTSWRNGVPPPAVSGSALRLASWQAARYGVHAALVHPITGAAADASIVLADLVATVAGAVGPADRDRIAAGVDRIATRGSGADWQRMRYAETGSLARVAQLATDATQRGIGEAEPPRAGVPALSR